MAADVKSLLGKARLPERTVELCLRGDLVARVEDLERQLRDLPESDTDLRLAGNSERRQLAEQITAVQEQMRDATAVFRLRALTRRAWDALVRAHPVRKGDDGGVHPEDKGYAYNTESFFDALIRACVVDPVLDDGEWETLLDHITPAQFATLNTAAVGLNLRGVDVPFSHAASQILTSEPG
jgi:hypothetical protein